MRTTQQVQLCGSVTALLSKEYAASPRAIGFFGPHAVYGAMGAVVSRKLVWATWAILVWKM
jgi:hypothetical protein